MDEEKSKPSGSYEVGYGRPPKETQFKKGQPSANPKGRPRKPKPGTINVHQMLTSCVEIRVGNKKVWITGTEARLRGMIRGALAGKLPAIRMFLNECERHRLLETDPLLKGGVIRVPKEICDEFFAIVWGPGGHAEAFAKFPQWTDWLYKEPADAIDPPKKRRRPRKYPDWSETERDMFIRLVYERRPYAEGERRGEEFVSTIIMRRLVHKAVESIQAAKLVKEYLHKYGEPQNGDKPPGFLLGPEGIDVDEYKRKYCEPPPDWNPADHPPGTDWVTWDNQRLEQGAQRPGDNEEKS